MKCQEAQTLVAPYLEGKLNLEKSMELVRHIRGCERCREELEFYLVVMVTTETIGDEGMSGDYKEAVEQLLRRTEQDYFRAVRRKRVRKCRLVAVLMFVLIVLGMSMSSETVRIVLPPSAVKPSFRLELPEVPEKLDYVGKAIRQYDDTAGDYALSCLERRIFAENLHRRDERIQNALLPGGSIVYAMPEEAYDLAVSLYTRLRTGKLPERKPTYYIELKKGGNGER